MKGNFEKYSNVNNNDDGDNSVSQSFPICLCGSDVELCKRPLLALLITVDLPFPELALQQNAGKSRDMDWLSPTLSQADSKRLLLTESAPCATVKQALPELPHATLSTIL